MVVLNRVLAAIACALLFTSATPRTPPPSPDDLYSRRALRRARFIIQMRLLEYRKERLECLRLAIERNLPPDLRPPEPRPKGNRPLNPETCNDLFR